MIREAILKWLKLDGDPDSTRLAFNKKETETWLSRVEEYGVWYEGDSDILASYYLGATYTGQFARAYLYNRGKKEYFWSITTKPQEHIKKTHSGVPRAIVDTLVNVVGEPNYFADTDTTAKLNDILKHNNFKYLLSQQGRTLTLVYGWGAYKININSDISKYPTVQFYNALDCEYIYRDNLLVGIIYKDYYKDDHNNNYVLHETRYHDGTNSYITYKLFRKSRHSLTPVALDTIPALSALHDTTIYNFPYIFGVPSVYFYDQFHNNYGRSVYAGKLDVFDDMDQCLSQASTCIKYSTPIEYINSEFLQRGPDGQAGIADTYCRRYVMLEGEMDANGAGGTQAVSVTQPQLNTEQFITQYRALLKIACSGVLTPSTMGILDEARSNANAEREREKVTIQTRNNIIACESDILTKLYTLLLCGYEYMTTNKISTFNYNISIKYNEFANPTFENELRALGIAWSQGQLSTERYIKLLWKDRLSVEEMEREKEALDKNRQIIHQGNFYNQNEQLDAEQNITDGISDNPLNK